MTLHVTPSTCEVRPLLPGTVAVQSAVATVAAGSMVVVVDDEDREDEGDPILSASSVTPAQVAFVVRHTTGNLCAPMTGSRAYELLLPQMVENNADAHQTAFTVTVDHVDAGTRVSAADRARTFHALADAGTRPRTSVAPITCSPASA